jgi:hypothetical protein
MEADQLALLRRLLTGTRVLSLALVVDGEPVIGVLPFLASANLETLVVHGSRLARHSRGLAAGAAFSAALHEPDSPELDPLRLPRVLLDGRVEAVANDDLALAELRDSWVARFPSAAMTIDLGDFAFHRLRPTTGRLVAGFGAAFGLGPHVLRQAAGLPA